MRRKDREITDINEILDIIDHCGVCHIGLCDGDWPYVVPMNFGYTYENDQLILYFHGAREGRKLDILKKNNQVSFVMDCSHNLITHEIPCRYTMQFESVMGRGVAEFVTEETEKIEALNHVMKKYSDGKTFPFETKHVRIINVFKVVVSELSGKRSVKGGEIKRD